ncbi:MAG TPA: glycosyltransferase family 9 protein [Pseudonocardiaceae bacterium]|nr:glycosyltransferase family 9 protein [Pseudonocardiaceae bacterium]
MSESCLSESSHEHHNAVLVLRALGLGDLLTAVPALRGLRAAHPDHRLVLAAPAQLAELVALTGTVEELLPTAELGDLAGPSPAVAVNLHGRGPDSTRALRGLRPAVMLTHAHPEHPGVPGPDWETDMHEVHRWCRLLAYFGIPADPADLELIRPAQPSVAPGAIVVHPGCAFVARRWPAERYGVVAGELAKAGLPVVVTGNADQRPLALQVADTAGLPQRSVLAGQTSLVQLAALVAKASLVVCGDTGVAHLATAYSTPSVVLFGPVSPQHWGPPPQRPQHVALWAGSTGDTFADRPDPGLLQITTADVLDAAATARQLSPYFTEDGIERCLLT